MTITRAIDGELAKRTRCGKNNLLLLMPEKAKDQGFAMTGSYSCMTLTALLVFDPLPAEEKLMIVDTIRLYISKNKVMPQHSYLSS
ncbi:MAG: hypothetical protein K6T88_15425 [Bacillus sp. (in: Bacteria)]|nr:hypothetical protein [Bacillus sp. (in: firmicutes)]